MRNPWNGETHRGKKQETVCGNKEGNGPPARREGGYSIFRITVDRSRAFKWLFPQEKAILNAFKTAMPIPKMLWKSRDSFSSQKLPVLEEDGNSGWKLRNLDRCTMAFSQQV
jgi:hypothetical protein